VTPLLSSEVKLPGGLTALAVERLEGLERVRRFLAVERAQVLDILTEVGTLPAGSYEIEAARNTLAGAAAEVAEHRPRRLGHAAVFMPSNVLLYSYVLYLLIPSLFIDRISFRPAAQVRRQAERLHRLLAPVHGLPADLRLVSQRDFLAQDVPLADLVVFTGRFTNAEQVRAGLRPEQLMLYLGGGVNPFIVAAGADLAAAVRDLTEIRLFNAGQDCLAPDVVFVERTIADAFLDALIQRLAGCRFGPYRDPDADYGPIYYESAFEDAARYVFQQRHFVRHGGRIDITAMRIEPTVLVRDLAETRAFPEFFSPVFNVAVYDDDRQLISTLAANHCSERALGASLYGEAGEVASHLRKKHTVTCNETLFAADRGNQPFGGRGWMANYVSHHGRVTSQPILISQVVAQCLGTSP
jgi:acyl-CoA reductase-like NAD-dependent aldehyde dehydrogenase